MADGAVLDGPWTEYAAPAPKQADGPWSDYAPPKPQTLAPPPNVEQDNAGTEVPYRNASGPPVGMRQSGPPAFAPPSVTFQPSSKGGEPGGRISTMPQDRVAGTLQLAPEAPPAMQQEPSPWDEFKQAFKDAATHPIETVTGADLPAQQQEKMERVQQVGQQTNDPFIRAAPALAEAQHEPTLKPTILPGYDKLDPHSKNIMSRALQGGANGIAALSSPDNLGLFAGMYFLPEEASHLISGVFAAKMGQGAVSDGIQTIAAARRGDYGEAAERGANALISAAFATASGKHALGIEKGPSLKESAASGLTEGAKDVMGTSAHGPWEDFQPTPVDTTRTFTAGAVKAMRPSADVAPAVKFDTGPFDFDTFEGRPVVQGSTDPNAIRESAAAQEKPTVAAVEKAVEAVDGAEVTGSRVKDSESQQNKADRDKPVETQKDHLGVRVAADTPEAQTAAVGKIAETMPVVGTEPLDNNGLKGTQVFVRTGKEGDPNQTSEVQVLPTSQVEVLKQTDKLYDEQKQALAAGDQTKADALGKQIEAIHQAALKPVKSADVGADRATKYEFGSTQANLPEGSPAHAAILAMQKAISDSDLAGDGKDIDEPHVTVRYGLKGDITPELRAFIEAQVPFEASLGATQSFPPKDGATLSGNTEPAAVIMAPVESPELHKLNAAIEKAGDFKESDFPDYRPHVTVAYVKPEAAAKYTGMKDAEGKTFPIDSIAISDQNGAHTEIPLKGGAAKSKTGEGGRGESPEPTGGGAGNALPPAETTQAVPVPGASTESTAVPKSEAGQSQEVARPKSDGAQAQEQARPEDSHPLIHIDRKDAPREVLAWEKDDAAQLTGARPSLTITSQADETLDPKTLKTLQTWAGAQKLKQFETMPSDTAPRISVVRTSGGDYVVDGVHRATRAAKAGEQVKATVYTVNVPQVKTGSTVELPDGRRGVVKGISPKGDVEVKLDAGGRAKSTRDQVKVIDPNAPTEGVTSGTPGHEKPAHGAIAIDFDKTLSTYDGYKGPTVLGEPIAPQVDAVKKMLGVGEDVWIFSARVAHPEAVAAIKAWTKDHIGQELPVTNVKYPDFSRFIDDRAELPVQMQEGGKDAVQEPSAAGVLPHAQEGDRSEGGRGVRPGEQGAAQPAEARSGGEVQGNGGQEEEAKVELRTYEAEVSKYAGDPRPEMKLVQAENRRHAETLLAEQNPGKVIGGVDRVEAAPADPITEEKAVAPGTETPSAHEQKVARLEQLKEHLQDARKRVSDADGRKGKANAMYRLRDDVYKTQTAISNLEREIEGDRRDAAAAAKRAEIPLTKPEETVVTDPDKDKWGYQKEYFLKALEPAKDAWMKAYSGFGDTPEESWKFIVQKDMRSLAAPKEFPDDFIRIEIPGDGKFLVKNSPPAIDKILKSAPSAFAKPRGTNLSPGKEIKPRAPKELDNTKYIEQMEREVEDARKEKESYQRGGVMTDYRYYDDRIKAAEENLRQAKNPDPEAGFLDISPLVDMAAPLRNELERRSEIADVANNVHDVLTRLDRSNKATTLEAKGIARSFQDSGFSKEDGDKVFASIEDSAVKLTPDQINLKYKWIVPLDKRAAQQRAVTLLIKSLSDKDAQKRREKEGTEFTLEDILAGQVPQEEIDRVAPEQPNYQHRIAVDKNTLVDRILGDSMKRFRAGGPALSRTFSSGNRSVFYEIHGPDREREAVAVKGGRVTRFRMGPDGKPVVEDLGAFRSGLTDAGKETDERMAPFVQRITELRDEIADMPEADREEQLADVQKRIQYLEKQMDLLNKVKAPVGRTSAFGGKVVYSTEPTFRQRAEISRKLEPLRKREERLKAGTEPMLAKNQRKLEARKEELQGNEDFRDDVLNDGEKLEGQTWKDKNGDQWKFDRGTTKFITERTGQKYHDNAMLSSLVNWMETNKAMNAAIVMERMKGILEDQGMAVQSDNPLTVPDGWKGTTLQQMRGYYFPTHVAESLDQYASLQSRGQANIAEKANRFMIQTVLMNPLMHGKNILANWFTGQAAEAITGRALVPRWYGENAKAGVKAVNTLKDMGGTEYRRLLRLGLDLQGANTSFDQTTKEILRGFTDQLAAEPEQNKALSALMGVADAGKWLQSKNHLATFGLNDLFLLQSFYAREAQLEREGMDPEKAEMAARDWAHLQVAEYTTPIRVGGSAALGRLLENPNLSAFWRYHFGGILRPVINAVKESAGSFRPDESASAGGEERNSRGQTASQARINAIARLVVLTAFATVVFPKILDKLAKKITGDQQAKFPRGGTLGFASNIAETIGGERTTASTLSSVFTPALGTEELAEIGINRDFFTGRHIMGTNVGAEDKVKQLAAWLSQKSMPGQLTHRIDQGKGKQALFSLLGFTFPMEHGLLEAAKIRSEAAGSNPPDPKQAKVWQSILAAAEQAQRSGGKDTRLKDALLHSGQLKHSQRKELIAASHEAPIVFATSDLEHDADVWQVFEHSTDEEKAQLIHNSKTHAKMLKYEKQMRADGDVEQAEKVKQALTR